MGDIEQSHVTQDFEKMACVFFFRTFDYIQRELPKVPEHIPVLILANHCDMAHHRAVTSDHVLYFIESVQR